MYTFVAREFGLQRLLQRIGIPVVFLIVRTFIGIQKDMRLAPLEFIAGTAVGLQRPNIFTDKFLQRFHFFIFFTSFIRKAMAFLWASSISPCAILATAGPIASTPWGVMCWNVTLRI